MVQYAWLIPLFPLIAYLLLLVMGRRASEGVVATIAVLSTLVGFIFALGALSGVAASGVYPPTLFDWFTFGTSKLQIGFEVTPLDAIMLAVVTFVSTMVFLFSRGYMHGDQRFSVYYQYLCLFVFSMLGLVISPNLLQTYIFWELVGLCSYLLVGFWYFKPEAAAAAKKSFIVTRLGDVGLFIGIILLFLATGSFNYSDIFAALQAHHLALNWMSQDHLLTLVAILIFIGAIGKSAQFPLHVWLPDAMEGPTPVSALIHAATMVAAGVYLVARTFPLFASSGTALETVAIIGGFTALFAASIGLTQNDIKRVIAYSTISQLGYMMLGLGVSATAASTFHLLTHAFFKALLFLAAGSIIHSANTQDLREMGGLWRKMPITAWTFLFGALALSGIPPFAGFWSKDEIIGAAFQSGHTVLGVFAVVAAFFTAFYIFRVYFLAFTGSYRGESKHEPHESGPAMTIPLVLLALLSLLAGFVNVPFFGNPLEKFLSIGGQTGATYDTSYVTMGVSAVVGVIGIVLAWFMYGKRSISAERTAKGFGPLYKLSFNKYYFDELYHAIIVVPVVWIAKVLNFIDRWIVDGIVSLVGQIGYVSSLGIKYGQNGQVQTYGL
ncbi:MAG: NADH-quinone oxidoreductase subunit, partial [Bacilli bacterium]|nr:NADH-quinone oxidoreductase subunit [Bacilli bacterium]